MKGETDVLLISLTSELVTEAVEETFEKDPATVHLRPFVGLNDENVRTFCSLFLTEATLEAPGTSLMVATLGRALALHLLREHSNLSTVAPRKVTLLPTRRLGRVLD